MHHPFRDIERVKAEVFTSDITANLRLPEVKQRLADQGAEIVGSSPTQFAAYLRAETEKWAKVVKAAGIKQE